MTPDERKAWVHDLLMEETGRLNDPIGWADGVFFGLLGLIMNPYADQAARDRVLALMISRAPSSVAAVGTYHFLNNNKEFDL